MGTPRRRRSLFWLLGSGLLLLVLGVAVAVAGPQVFTPSVEKLPVAHRAPDTSALSPELSTLPRGFTDPMKWIVRSDGSHSLGDPKQEFNQSRDQGSKLAYFHPQRGNNATADVYFWDGKRLVDSKGRAKNAAGLEYGTNPLEPNEQAIRPFATLTAGKDPRLRTQAASKYRGDGKAWRFAGLAGGYPDWFLFRRGQTHTTFDTLLTGGRSEKEPMVIAAYGPIAQGRAVIAPRDEKQSPFSGHNFGAAQSWLHHALYSLEIRDRYGFANAHHARSYGPGGGPVTAYIEDCYFPSREGGIISYAPTKTMIRRSILTGSWLEEHHNQGYFTNDFDAQVTFDGVIFYRNGYKQNPLTDPDPRRDIYSRNIYQGGGAKLGHVYHNIISADGASGGPQMRLGGIIENSLIVEGYWFLSTRSNSPENRWMQQEGQVGQSGRVRNNVQLIYDYPTVADPDVGERSDARAQTGNGFILQGASFGVVMEGNILTGAMLQDELGQQQSQVMYGLLLEMPNDRYKNGTHYAQRNNTILGNLFYRTKAGVRLGEGGKDAKNLKITDNVFVSQVPVEIWKNNTLDDASQLLVASNRFYASEPLPKADFIGENVSEGSQSAAKREGWPDPNRTLKRYVTEVLGLTLLDWKDDPHLEPALAAMRIQAKETYDPTGLKTFMTVATKMRRGGTVKAPSQGKPCHTHDYAWDERYEAIAVVNWIRAGFGWKPVAVPRSSASK